jgi:hypothetical protein
MLGKKDEIQKVLRTVISIRTPLSSSMRGGYCICFTPLTDLNRYGVSNRAHFFEH